MKGLSSRDVAALVNAASAVASQPDLKTLLRTTVSMARKAVGARYAAMGVIGLHGTLIDFIHDGLDEETAEKIGRYPIGKGVLGTLIRDPATIRVDTIEAHPDSVGFPPHHPPMKSFLGVPVRAGDEVFGNLYLTEKAGGFSSDDEALVEAVAAIAGGAILSARLKERLTRLALIEDRERIARDLHDAVIQDLFAVGLALQSLALSLADDTARESLDAAVDQIDASIASLRTFIFDLRQTSMLRTDPALAIRRMAERLAGPHGVDVEVTVLSPIDVSPGQLDDGLLVIREAVSNAVRHGKPSTITIELSQVGAQLQLTIRDDGRGFERETAKHGMGLDNMRERVDHRQGAFDIESAPGCGTIVRATVGP